VIFFTFLDELEGESLYARATDVDQTPAGKDRDRPRAAGSQRPTVPARETAESGRIDHQLLRGVKTVHGMEGSPCADAVPEQGSCAAADNPRHGQRSYDPGSVHAVHLRLHVGQDRNRARVHRRHARQATRQEAV
jgi:hypothetical protein